MNGKQVKRFKQVQKDARAPAMEMEKKENEARKKKKKIPEKESKAVTGKRPQQTGKRNTP